MSGSGLTIETVRVTAHNTLAQRHTKGLRRAETGFIREDIVISHWGASAYVLLVRQDAGSAGRWQTSVSALSYLTSKGIS